MKVYEAINMSFRDSY